MGELKEARRDGEFLGELENILHYLHRRARLTQDCDICNASEEAQLRVLQDINRFRSFCAQLVGEPLYRDDDGFGFGRTAGEFLDLAQDFLCERVEVYDSHPQRLVKHVVSHDDSGDGVADRQGALGWDVSKACSG